MIQPESGAGKETLSCECGWSHIVEQEGSMVGAQREGGNRDTIIRFKDLSISLNEKENPWRGLKLNCGYCCTYTVINLPSVPYCVTFFRFAS